MKKLSVLGVFVLGLATCFVSAPAQAAPAPPSKFQIFVGYSYLSVNNSNCFECFSESVGLHGYTGSAVYNFTKHVGLEANFEGHNGTPTIESETATTDNGFKETARDDFYGYTFGPKLSQNVGNFTLFAHVLVGGAHVHQAYKEVCILGTDSEGCFSNEAGTSHGNGFAFKTGGGVDWNHGRFGIRILEVDYERVAANIAERDDGSNESTYTSPTSLNSMSLSAGFTINFGGMPNQ